MRLTRRQFLAASGAGILTTAQARAEEKKTGLGIAIASYTIRARVEQDKGFSDPLKFLEFCHERGAGGVQLPLGTRDADYVKKLRARAERLAMFIEGSSRTPRDQADVERFDAEVWTAKEAGAVVIRTVMLGGRRYETFKSAEEYRDFKERAWKSLQLAEPVMAKHKVRLAVENHKDFRADELADWMRRLKSEYVGICVDTGNNLALLEEPLHTVKTLAPWAACCHLKDMAVEEYADGFLLSEVPLGEGFLDLPTIVETLRKANAKIRFKLEMITRDPLQIPCLTDRYWATFGDVHGRDLARTLSLVRKHARKDRLSRFSTLGQAEQLAAEEINVQQCLQHAREKLRL